MNKPTDITLWGFITLLSLFTFMIWLMLDAMAELGEPNYVAIAIITFILIRWLCELIIGYFEL